MTEKITKRNVLQLWANQYPEVTRWLTKIQRKDQSALELYWFCEWAHKTPPELLALKEKDATISPPPNTVEKLLDDFCGDTSGTFKDTAKYNTQIAVKSFFKWSYRDLAKASGVVSYEKVKPYNAINKEGLRKLYNTALNPRDRALIPFVTCTGIAKETLMNLTWGHLEENWESRDLPCINIGSELLKGHGKGRYRGVRQITFLTPEAKAALIFYKGYMEDKLGRRLTPADHIWLKTFKPYAPLKYGILGQLIVDLSHRANVPFSLHDGRRWVNTALESIGISSNWARKIRGRKVKGEEAPYSQPSIEALRNKFREAVPALEFTTEGARVSKETEDRLKALEDFKKGLTPDMLEKGKRAGLLFRKAKIDERAQAEIEKELAKEKDCKDNEHCGETFKQVNESDLLAHLKEGWTIAYKVTNGQVIVKR